MDQLSVARRAVAVSVGANENPMPDAYFCVFRAERNAESKAQGAPPSGAVTFCSNGENIRAFPGKAPEGGRVWYAQYRQVSANGALWRMIKDANKQPICYVGAHEALTAATLVRDSHGHGCR